MKKHVRLVIALSLGFLAALQLWAQGNGNLQIHYIDVGQGDGALLITPSGKTVLFDSGAMVAPGRTAAYLDGLGVKKIDYLVTSHYHSDHCGDLASLVNDIGLPGVAYDRGQPKTISGTFVAYDKVLHSVRKTVEPGTTLTLDESAPNPVRIDFVADNGNGVSTNDENDQSVDCVVRFGGFAAEFGGDLSGFEHRTYHDIETSVAPKVGQVDVYKVHHHGSSHSTNQAWIDAIKPRIGIISCGNGNTYGHPTEEALATLHQAGVVTYWTEVGNGAKPVNGADYVGGDIVVQVPASGNDYTVTFGGGQTHQYATWKQSEIVATSGAGGASGSTASAGSTVAPPSVTATPAVTGQTYVWSTKSKSKVYHYADCAYCNSISAANRASGSTPPEGFTLHQDCPR